MRRVLLALALSGCSQAALPPEAWEPPERSEAPHVFVDHPTPGETLGGPSNVFLAGRIAPSLERGERLDLVLAIDTSGSVCLAPATLQVTGTEPCAEPGPGSGEAPGRVLDAEIAGARALLARLDPELTRVGVVSFGEPLKRALHRFQGPDTGFLGTRLELAPTADFGAVARSLDALAAREPDGATNLAGALGRATHALLAEPDPAARRVIVLLTDGVPTAPRETPRENLVECLRAADRAAHHGVRVLAFALGEAAREPLAVVEIAERTGGALYPLPDAADLPGLLAAGAARPDRVAHGAQPHHRRGCALRAARRGRHLGRRRLRHGPGANRLEVRARTEAGLEVQREIDSRVEPGGGGARRSRRARRAARRGPRSAELATRLLEGRSPRARGCGPRARAPRRAHRQQREAARRGGGGTPRARPRGPRAGGRGRPALSPRARRPGAPLRPRALLGGKPDQLGAHLEEPRRGGVVRAWAAGVCSRRSRSSARSRRPAPARSRARRPCRRPARACA